MANALTGVALLPVALPAAATDINGFITTPVVLQSYAGTGAVSIDTGTFITTPQDTAVQGDGSRTWTVDNQGTVIGLRGVDLVSGTLQNEGSISGLGDVGVRMSEGSITNTRDGQITGAQGGVVIDGGSGTITNAGVIRGSSVDGVGVVLQNGGTVNNSGLISGTAVGIQVTAGTALIQNTGTISGDSLQGTGVLFTGTGQGTIDNFGTIIGGSGTAVRFGTGTNRLIIESGGVLSGTVVGDSVNANPGDDTVELRGTGALSAAQIVGIGKVLFNGSNTALDSKTTVDNPTIGTGSTISNAGTLTGAVIVEGGGTLKNAGTILGGGSIDNAGSLDNSGIVIAVDTTKNTAGTITNTGTILGGSAGISSAGGTISNSGSISGGDVGVVFGPDGFFTGGGLLTNEAGGYIKGGEYGISVTGVAVTNAGTILDDAIAGALVGNNAAVANLPGGTIGGVVGVLFNGTGATVSNTGTITGTGGVAVQFDAGVNTLELGTGSVLNGAIDGGGGAGQVVLNGTGTLTNAITGFGVGSALTINNGAAWTAAGNWTIASVNNAGTFQAGTLSSPLRLTGNFSQGSGATLVAAIDANGSHTQFVVDGTASLAGTLSVVYTGALPTIGTPYTILSATGGVSGTFGNVLPAYALLRPSVTYNPDSVVVSMAQLPVSTATADGATRNQRATAAALDRGIATNPALFATTLTSLDQMSGSQVRSSLDRMSGEIHASLPTVALMAGDQFINQVQQQSTLARLTGDAAGGRQQFASLNGTPVSDSWSSKPWGVWTSGYGQSGHLDGDGNSHRLNESIAGSAIGVDYKVNPDLKVGVVTGYGSSSDRLDNGAGHAHVDYTQLGAYGSYTRGPAYLDGIIGVAFGDGRTSRDVSLPGAPGTARADVSSTQLLGKLETGYKLPLNDVLTLTPLAGLSLGTVWQHGYTEHGGGALDLDVQSQTKSSVKSTLGARLSADVPVGKYLMASSLQVSWAHEFAPTDRNANAYFAGVPSSNFSVTGARAATNGALVVAGLASKISSSSSLYVNYDGYFSSAGNSNAVMGGFKYVW